MCVWVTRYIAKLDRQSSFTTVHWIYMNSWWYTIVFLPYQQLSLSFELPAMGNIMSIHLQTKHRTGERSISAMFTGYVLPTHIKINHTVSLSSHTKLLWNATFGQVQRVYCTWTFNHLNQQISLPIVDYDSIYMQINNDNALHWR